MSDEQLWTDEKIENRLDALGFIEHKDVCYIDYGEVADFIEDEVRDEYEAERAKLMQRIDELATTIGERDKLIGHLSRQLAEREAWIPLPDGYNTGRIDNFEIQIGLDTGSLYIFNIRQNRKCWRVPLHENLKLCLKQSEASDE
jgi:hypothetical protein